jgi:hypothetical protein
MLLGVAAEQQELEPGCGGPGRPGGARGGHRQGAAGMVLDGQHRVREKIGTETTVGVPVQQVVTVAVVLDEDPTIDGVWGGIQGQGQDRAGLVHGGLQRGELVAFVRELLVNA